jgi:hypothetical protein
MQLHIIALQAGILGMIVLLVNGLNYRIRHFSSDHQFHLNMIREMKRNGHRFLNKYPRFIGCNTIGCPQLFHWIFSFIDLKNIHRVVFIYKCIIYGLDLLFFFLFFKQGFIDYSSTLSPYLFYFFASLLFIFTPFNYVKWNASNTGLSPRSLGVMLGRVFVYVILLYTGNHSLVWIPVLVFISYIILLASQFAFQYVLFFCFLYACFSFNIMIGLVPVAGAGVFLMLNPRACKRYLACQYQHKKIYATHFAKRFILAYRPSIWRDFIYDFWKKIGKEKWRAIPYIQTNSLVTLFWGFTIIPLGIYTSFKIFMADPGISLYGFIASSILLQVLLITVFIMLLTSFSITRFLGEPERYLEFAIPAAIFLFIKSYSSQFVYYLIFLYIILSLLLIWVNKRYDRASIRENLLLKLEEKDEKGNSVLSTLENLENKYGFLNIFSNNEEITRRLLFMENAAFLIPDIAAAKTGPFLYQDIFASQYPFINESLLLPMIREFAINVFIVDRNKMTGPVETLLQPIQHVSWYKDNHFELVFIAKRD